MSSSSTSSPVLGQIVGQDDFRSYHRGRSIKSCLECRRRKMRCSRSQPCHNCNRFSRECHYVSSPNRHLSPGICKASVLPDRCSQTDNVDRGWTIPEYQPEHQRDEQEEQLSFMQTTPRIGSSSIPGYDGRYSVNSDKQSTITDLRIGRLRITEWLGGLSGAQLASKVSLYPSYNLPCCFTDQ